MNIKRKFLGKKVFVIVFSLCLTVALICAMNIFVALANEDASASGDAPLAEEIVQEELPEEAEAPEEELAEGFSYEPMLFATACQD